MYIINCGCKYLEIVLYNVYMIYITNKHMLLNTFIQAASWLTKMLTNSNVELKRNGESVNANPEFWGVRGKRSSEG